MKFAGLTPLTTKLIDTRTPKTAQTMKCDGGVQTGRRCQKFTSEYDAPYNVWLYGFSWMSLFILHAGNLTYYVGVAWLYRQFDLTFLEHQLEFNSIGISKTAYPTVSSAHACVAAIHAFFMMLMTGSSIHARRLVFQPDSRAVIHTVTRKFSTNRVVSIFKKRRVSGSSTSPASVPRHHPITSLTTRVLESVIRVSSFIFARDGLLGVDSVVFDHVILVREIIETSLQSYQLYRMSLVLARPWLIRFYLALLVINCWVTPLLHRYYRHREILRRLLCLLCDAILDMVSSIGVSVVIFATYAPQYSDPHGFGFPFILWFDDEWASNMQQEFQIMLVASYNDLASRLIFALGLVQCMESIKDLLTPFPRHTNKFPVLPAIDSTIKSLAMESVTQTDGVNAGPTWIADSITPRPATGDFVAHSPTLTCAFPAHRRVPLTNMAPRNTSISRITKSSIVHIGGPGLFALWGFSILIVHLAAESRHIESL